METRLGKLASFLNNARRRTQSNFWSRCRCARQEDFLDAAVEPSHFVEKLNPGFESANWSFSQSSLLRRPSALNFSTFFLNRLNLSFNSSSLAKLLNPFDLKIFSRFKITGNFTISCKISGRQLTACLFLRRLKLWAVEEACLVSRYQELGMVRGGEKNLQEKKMHPFLAALWSPGRAPLLPRDGRSRSVQTIPYFHFRHNLN